MLAEFAGKMVECDEVRQLSWGPKLLIVREPPDPVKQKETRAQIMAICAEIQRELNEREAAKE